MRGPPGPLEAAPSPPSPFLLVAPQSTPHSLFSPLASHAAPARTHLPFKPRSGGGGGGGGGGAPPRGVSSAASAFLVRARSLAPPPPVFFLFRSFVVASPPFPSFPAKHRRMLFPCPFCRRARTRSEHSFGGREGEKNARFGEQSSSRSVDQAPSRDTEQAFEKRAIDNYAQHSFSFLMVLFYDDFGRLLLCVKLECMFISVFCCCFGLCPLSLLPWRLCSLLSSLSLVWKRERARFLLSSAVAHFAQCPFVCPGRRVSTRPPSHSPLHQGHGGLARSFWAS